MADTPHVPDTVDHTSDDGVDDLLALLVPVDPSPSGTPPRPTARPAPPAPSAAAPMSAVEPAPGPPRAPSPVAAGDGGGVDPHELDLEIVRSTPAPDWLDPP